MIKSTVNDTIPYIDLTNQSYDYKDGKAVKVTSTFSYDVGDIIHAGFHNNEIHISEGSVISKRSFRNSDCAYNPGKIYFEYAIKRTYSEKV